MFFVIGDTPKTAESFCCNCTKSIVKEDCTNELLGCDMFTVDEIINGKVVSCG